MELSFILMPTIDGLRTNKYKNTFFFRDKETEVLKQQISLLKDAIYREQEKSADLEMKSK